MRDIVLTLVFGCLSFGSLFQPWLGVLAWSWIGYMNPHRLCYGFAYSLPFAAVAAGVTMAGLVISSEPKRIPWTREVVLLLAFVAWFTLTAYLALNPEGAWIEWNKAIKIQIMVLVTLIVMVNRDRLNRLVWVIALSVGFYGVKGGLFALKTGGTSQVMGPPDSFIGGNNEIALALVMVLPLMRYLQLQTRRRWVKLGLMAAQTLTALAVLSTYSRAGFLALTTVMIFMWLKSRRRLLYGIVLAVVIPVVVEFMPNQWSQRMNTINSYESDASALGRINAWWFAYNLVSDRPIIGGGFRVFTEELFVKYAPEPFNHHDAHSIYFQVLGEQGYPGLGLFLGLAVCTWFSGSWTIRHARAMPQLIWAGDLAAMCQVGLTGYAVGGAFAGLAYFDLPYHLMSIIVLCKTLVRNAEAESTGVAAHAA